jgi:hypothetical protein
VCDGRLKVGRATFCTSTQPGVWRTVGEEQLEGRMGAPQLPNLKSACTTEVEQCSGRRVQLQQVKAC